MYNKKKIIFIDDEEIVLRDYTRLLDQNLNYSIATFVSPLDALHAVQNESSDIIVVADLHMPEMNGIELISKVKQVNPDWICLLLTGKAELGDAIDAINRGGIFQFLTKPCNKNQLLKTLDAASDHYDLIQKKKTLMAELLEANENLASFVAVMVHDLKNPLGSITGIASFLQKDNTSLDDEARELIKSIEEVSSRSVGMIDEMLQSVRIKSGKTKINLIRENPYLDIAEIIDSFHGWAENKAITIINTITEELPQVEYDRKAFQRAISNLISNAIKYSLPNSKITVSAETMTEEFLKIVVKDNGLGMSQKDLEEVFGEFQRLSARPTAGESSTGLGLSIVKKLVEDMGGSVGVHSVGKDQGSTFWFTLKIVNATSY